MRAKDQEKFSLYSLFKRIRLEEFDEIHWGEYLVEFLLCAGAIMVLGGFTILGLQAIDYANMGEWAPRPLMLLLDTPPEIASVEVGNFVHWFLDFSQSGTLIVIGLLVIFSHVAVELMWQKRD